MCSSVVEHVTDNDGVGGPIPPTPTRKESISMRIIWSIIGIAFGTIMIWKTYPLVNLFGKSDWAERYFSGGLGGTYFLYKVIGLAVVILSGLYMFGILDILLFPFRSIFGGFGPK